jgi:hypothetical protein
MYMASYKEMVGKYFPVVRARSLKGQDVTVQNYLGKAEAVFLSIGFTYESQYQLNPWVKHVEERYHHRLYPLTMAIYDTFYGKLFRGWIDQGMVNGSNPAEHESTLTTTEDSFVKNSLGITDRTLAYYFLIDSEGIVRWTDSGRISEQKAAELDAAVQKFAVKMV